MLMFGRSQVLVLNFGINNTFLLFFITVIIKSYKLLKTHPGNCVPGFSWQNSLLLSTFHAVEFSIDKFIILKSKICFIHFLKTAIMFIKFQQKSH